ncbi:hypothetical protein [Streptomyces solicathayae]|uniref:Uncharacterized protein n=1 Tax=Streptomyces solicathayae TaxID=3081768 RepID=A0ABZ0M0N9_9ACTN|nr:hypothetical protein [Streptomyces sp. HUAS YS2]WOX24614.1 hypothetical protein R2D22_25835 [Streptomyces sp. HUAS YS2]
MRRALAASLMDLGRIGADYSTEDLLPYAELAAAAAKLDLDRIKEVDDAGDRFRLAEHAAIVVLLLEPVLAVLRRLAQEDETRRRGGWARPDEATAPRSGGATD